MNGGTYRILLKRRRGRLVSAHQAGQEHLDGEARISSQGKAGRGVRGKASIQGCARGTMAEGAVPARAREARTVTRQGGQAVQETRLGRKQWQGGRAARRQGG